MAYTRITYEDSEVVEKQGANSELGVILKRRTERVETEETVKDRQSSSNGLTISLHNRYRIFVALLHSSHDLDPSHQLYENAKLAGGHLVLDDLAILAHDARVEHGVEIQRDRVGVATSFPRQCREWIKRSDVGGGYTIRYCAKEPIAPERSQDSQARVSPCTWSSLYNNNIFP